MQLPNTGTFPGYRAWKAYEGALESKICVSPMGHRRWYVPGTNQQRAHEGKTGDGSQCRDRCMKPRPLYRGLHRKSCTRTSAALTLLSESGPVEGKPRNIFSQRMDGTLGTSFGLIGALSLETWLGLGAIPKNSRRIIQVAL